MLMVTPPKEILGKKIETDFRKWMKFALMWDSPLLLPEEKCSLSLLNILGEIPPDEEKHLAAIIDFYLCGESRRESEPAKERLLDWEADSAAIWADFRVYVGIDLDRERMHWWEFMALFRSLPEDARIRQIMELRAVDLSKIQDQKTRDDYARRKRMVTLEPETFEDWM